MAELLEDRIALSGFADGFEGPTLDPFWTRIENSGAITFPSTGQVHSGTQAVRMDSTAFTGQKGIALQHVFPQPLFGRVSVWVFDTGADQPSSNYASLDIGNTVLGKNWHIAGRDYDLGPGGGDTYYLNNYETLDIITAVDRTLAWHHWVIDSRPDGVSFEIDGSTVYSTSTPMPFNEVHFDMFGPTWRPAWTYHFDDFEFTPYAPDIAATKLEWNTAQAGVDFGYQVEGAALTQDTTAALYWSADATFDPQTDTLAYATPLEHPQGTYGPFYVPNSVLGTPPPGATHLLLVVDPPSIDKPHGLIEETNEDNNVFVLPLPDLVGSSFHYRVLEDQHPDASQRVDGPLPFNAHFDISAEVKNRGAGEAGRFTVVFLASKDSVIDSGDVPLGTVTVAGLPPNTAQSIALTNLQLPQHLPWTGKIVVGMIIDPNAELPQIESSRENNSNQAPAVDHATVQLYDPIPPVTEIRGFRTLRATRLYLLLHGFHPVPPRTGSGWSRPLSPFTFFVSRFDGKVRSGLAYRQNAFIEFDAAHNTFWILLQGSSTVAEPNPETALFYDFLSPGWFAYVFDWHRRF